MFCIKFQTLNNVSRIFKCALSIIWLVNPFCNNNYSKGNFLGLYNMGGHGRPLEYLVLSRHRTFVSRRGRAGTLLPKTCQLTLIRIQILLRLKEFTSNDLYCNLLVISNWSHKSVWYIGSLSAYDSPDTKLCVEIFL